MAASGRRSGQGRSRHRRAARRQEHGDHRRCRRRIRNPRLDRRDGPRHSEGSVAHLHDPRPRASPDRDLEGRRQPGSHRRRIDLGDRLLRSDHQHILGASAIRDRTGTMLIVRATTSTPTAPLPSTPTPARSSGTSSTRRTTPTIMTASPRTLLADVDGQEAGARSRSQRLRLRRRPDRRQVPLGDAVREAGDLDQGHRPRNRQARGIRPKKQVQIYNAGSDAEPHRNRRHSAPATWVARTGRRRPTIRTLKTWYIPVIESCNRITIKPETKANKPREFFTGGGPSQLFRSRAASPRSTSPPARSPASSRPSTRFSAGMLATPDLVFSGHPSGEVYALDAKTLPSCGSSTPVPA